MSNVKFTADTERYVNTLFFTNDECKISSLVYRVSMMINNIKELYGNNNRKNPASYLTDGTSFSFNQYGFPNVTIEYLEHFGHGDFTVNSACAEVVKILYRLRDDTVYASILNDCEHKSRMLPKGFQIRLNDLNPSALTNPEFNHFATMKEYRLHLDNITFYVSIREDDKLEIWPRLFCIYYEVDIRTDKLVPKYLHSIKIDSIMNYHIPSNLDLEYTIY